MVAEDGATPGLQVRAVWLRVRQSPPRPPRALRHGLGVWLPVAGSRAPRAGASAEPSRTVLRRQFPGPANALGVGVTGVTWLCPSPSLNFGQSRRCGFRCLAPFSAAQGRRSGAGGLRTASLRSRPPDVWAPLRRGLEKGRRRGAVALGRHGGQRHAGLTSRGSGACPTAGVRGVSAVMPTAFAACAPR